MYSHLVFLCLVVATVRAAPAATDVVPLEKQQPTVIPIVSQSEELEPNGTYKFSYETGNGIKREETSYDKVLPKVAGRSAAGDSNEGGESDESNEVHVQQGSYSYTAPDGTVISVRYIADENGFRPTGDHIPQSIVAAAAAAGSSGEKSGRALNVADSEHSASAPQPAAAAARASELKTEKPAVPESAPVEPSKTTTSEGATATESKGTTENASEASPSTTDAAASTTVALASTTEAGLSTTEAGTTSSSSEATGASDASTPAEATTKATDGTTTAASEEPSSTSANASTTEASSTVAA